MDPSKTAVVLIEYQNDFTSDGGTLHDAVNPVMESTQMLPHTVETVARARALGATIIHAPITFTPDYHELTSEPYGILKGVVDSKSFRKGTWGAEIVDDLSPQEGDIVIEGKRGSVRLLQHQPRFYPAQPGHYQYRAGRLPDQLLCRVDHAQRLRARLQRDHPDRLHRHPERGRAAPRGGEELPHVLAPDGPRHVSGRPQRRGRGHRQRARLHGLNPISWRSLIPGRRGFSSPRRFARFLSSLAHLAPDKR